MRPTTDLGIARRVSALHSAAAKTRARFERRWPGIDFLGDNWPIKSQYKTMMVDVRFGPTSDDFEGFDADFLLALRCLLADAALNGRTKFPKGIQDAWRLLAKHLPKTSALAALRTQDLRDVEAAAVETATSPSAGPISRRLGLLSRQLDLLAELDVVERLTWAPSANSRTRLRRLTQGQQGAFKTAKAESLDRQIEAFSEATAAMLRNDPRLSIEDRAAIAVTNIMMCAPSRINEPLCLGINDRFCLDDYNQRNDVRPDDDLLKVHQLLLMKGSKGAQWAPKPILTFMVALANKCWDVLLDLGKYSRQTVAWYELHPNMLYLPSQLEHLRGRPLTMRSIWKIVNLTDAAPQKTHLAAVYKTVWWPLTRPESGRAPIEPIRFSALNSECIPNSGPSSDRGLLALPWNDVEALLLEKVRERLVRIRKVTPDTHYEGKLSEMLALRDSDISPYLPQALTDQGVRLRLKSLPSRARADPSVFIKLGLKMTRGGKVVDCYLEPHDTRRWLTTQALSSKERLSDVLINKWANRLSLDQLAAYDLRSSEERAIAAAAPHPKELTDLGEGLHALQSLDQQYGLPTDVITAHGHGIAVTSMEAVCAATEDRPIARVGGEIIILYPNRFGICLHQHHEAPCRSYKCVGCNEQIVVKGHQPTNDQWRREAVLSNRSIVNQLQSLIIARNRGIADDQDLFDSHLLALVSNGLDPQVLTDELIDRFQGIKDSICDPNFKRALEQAFIAHGVVRRLDDPDIAGGALIKYRDASRHAAPGHERAIESQFGARSTMEAKGAAFYEIYPEFAPAALGLKDQRELLIDENDDEQNDEQAA